MRTLLDKEMPRGGAMPGRRQWWFFGIAIGILFLATWLSGRSYLDKEKAGSVAQVAVAPAATGKVTSSGDKGQSTPAASQPASVDGSQATAVPADKDQQPAAQQNEPAAPDKGVAQSRAEPPVIAAIKSPDNKAAPVAATPDNKNSITNKLRNNNRQPNADDAIITLKGKRTGKNKGNFNDHYDPRGNSRAKKGSAGSATQNNEPASETAIATKNNHNNRAGKYANEASNPESDLNRFLSKPYVDRVQVTNVRPPLRFIDQPGPVLAPGITIEKDYARKRAGLPEPPPDKAPARRKPLKTREAGTMALGFALPLAFPLGDQRAMGYNLWGGHNTVSDYLPSPYLQYHLSGKTYLQTEAQFVSPQFISSTLLSYTTTNTAPNYYTSNAVYAKKLYYFNVPVSIHHSPFPGFYMGTGIQFSSMISGVALSEVRKWSPGGPNTLVSETYSRFKNDSLSQKINGNEFRVLLDANYYFNNFTVGLRYNQALSNYISFRLTPGMPYQFDKNRALQFYMRYNLWEEKKKAKANKTMLTLK
ncbi:hypothetical protein [Paraflavitalea soli]|nr:hypothetical protein [Paraflavitalea soli]